MNLKHNVLTSVLGGMVSIVLHWCCWSNVNPLPQARGNCEITARVINNKMEVYIFSHDTRYFIVEFILTQEILKWFTRIKSFQI